MEKASVESESMEAKVKMVKSIVGSEISETDVLKALSLSNNNAGEAVDIILDSPALCSLQAHLTAHKTLTSTGGTRVQVSLSKNLGGGVEGSEGVSVDGLNVEKQDFLSVGNGEVAGILEGERDGVVKKCCLGIGSMEIVRVKEEIDVCFAKAEFSAEEKRDLSGERSPGQVGRSDLSFEDWLSLNYPEKKEEKKEEMANGAEAESRVKEEPNVGIHDGIDAVDQEPLGVEIGEIAVPMEGEREGSVLRKCDMGVGAMEVLKVKEERDVGFVEGEGLGDEKKDLSGGERSLVLAGRSNLNFEDYLNLKYPERKEKAKQELSSSVMAEIRVKEEPSVGTEAEVQVTSGEKVGTRVKEGPSLNVENKSAIVVKEEVKQLISVQPVSARKLSDDEYRMMQWGCNNGKAKRERAEEMILSSVVIEDGDFPEEPGWLLVGRTVISGLSTTKGRKLENNEIVHFTFPSPNTRTKISTHFMSSKAAHAASSIVRFSTKRDGEVYILHFFFSFMTLLVGSSLKPA